MAMIPSNTSHHFAPDVSGPHLENAAFITDRMAVGGVFHPVFQKAPEQVRALTALGITHIVVVSQSRDDWPSLVSREAPEIQFVIREGVESQASGLRQINTSDLLALHASPSNKLLLMSVDGIAPVPVAWELMVGDGWEPREALRALCQVWPRSAYAVDPAAVERYCHEKGIPQAAGALLDDLVDLAISFQDETMSRDEAALGPAPVNGWLLRIDDHGAAILAHAATQDLPSVYQLLSAAPPELALFDTVFLCHRLADGSDGIVGYGLVDGLLPNNVVGCAAESRAPGGALRLVSTDFGDPMVIEEPILGAAVDSLVPTLPGILVKVPIEQVDPLLTAWDDLVVRSILDSPPQSAWLLVGSNASFPNGNEEDSDEVVLWTSSPLTSEGDLLFIYFIKPRKAVHLVARALSDAFFSSEMEVRAETEIDRHQWWVEITTPEPIDPIPLSRLEELAGKMQLHGRSGIYLRPDQAAKLIDDIKGDQGLPPQLQHILKQPVGLADIPEPTAIDFETWKRIASGAFALEAHVEQYVVEPLLRLALSEHLHVTWARQWPIKGGGAGGRTGLVDYAVLEAGEVRSIIEVKRALQTGNGDWASSPDVRQARRYAAALDVSVMLIDAKRILLFQKGADAPALEISRTTATQEDLETIAEHLMARS